VYKYCLSITLDVFLQQTHTHRSVLTRTLLSSFVSIYSFNSLSHLRFEYTQLFPHTGKIFCISEVWVHYANNIIFRTSNNQMISSPKLPAIFILSRHRYFPIPLSPVDLIIFPTALIYWCTSIQIVKLLHKLCCNFNFPKIFWTKYQTYPEFLKELYHLL
jgi:hypothetical protein